MRRTIPAGLVLAFALASCDGRRRTGDQRTIRDTGSNTMVLLAQMWAEAYRDVAPLVTVEVKGGGSNVGIRKLMEGQLDIVNSSRPMTEEEKHAVIRKTGKDPVEWTVGFDALEICVHKDNPVNRLSLKALADIFGEGGKTTTWSELAADAEGLGDIVTVGRRPESGTYDYFRDHVLGGKKFKDGVVEVAGSREVVELVGKTPNAIGYVGMGYVDPALVKPVSLSLEDSGTAYPPSVATVRDGTYPLARALYMYTLGQPTGHVEEYLAWVRSPPGQEFVERSGYIPFRALKE